MFFNSLVIKPGLDSFSRPVGPTVKKGLCFEIEMLIWKKTELLFTVFKTFYLKTAKFNDLID